MPNTFGDGGLDRQMATALASIPSLWLDLLGAEVRYYDAAGVRTRSIECGAGETVIMLHGIGGHAEAFARNVVRLGGGSPRGARSSYTKSATSMTNSAVAGGSDCAPKNVPLSSVSTRRHTTRESTMLETALGI